MKTPHAGNAPLPPRAAACILSLITLTAACASCQRDDQGAPTERVRLELSGEGRDDARAALARALRAPETLDALSRAALTATLEREGALPRAEGVRTWEELSGALSGARRAGEPPSDEELRASYERRHPGGWALRGAQVTLPTRGLWTPERHALLAPALSSWARAELGALRQRVLQGAPFDELAAPLCSGGSPEARAKEQLALLSAHTRAALARLHAGALSPVLEEGGAACVFLRAAEGGEPERAARGEGARELSRAALDALGAPTRLKAACLPLSPEGLAADPEARALTWLSARLLEAARRGALAPALESYALSLEPLNPAGWPPTLRDEARRWAESPAEGRGARWLVGGGPAGAVVALLEGAERARFEEERAALLREAAPPLAPSAEERRAALEERWEELAPRAAVGDGDLAPLELPAP